MPQSDEQAHLTFRLAKPICRPRPDPPSPEPMAKKQRMATDATDAALAELLLGLSQTPRSSPRTSNVSDKDFLRLSPPSHHEVASQSQVVPQARRSRRVGRQPLKLLSADSETEEGSEDAASGSFEFKPASKQQATSKEVPARCKCGKRVSASHPPCKSELMLLSEKFRDRFASSSGKDREQRIDLNDCAVALGVPRRRLYDITIVYEAAEVVRRTGKLTYVWQGLDHLPELIQRLQKQEELGEPVGDRKGNVPCPNADPITHSLWNLSRKFIRLLLTHEGSIQLSDAAAHLIGQRPGTRPQTYLTVERRLYDIGSILSTLDLIKRTYIEGKRQPAFSWNWGRGSSATDGAGEVEFAVSSPVKPTAAILLPTESAKHAHNRAQMSSALTEDTRAKQLAQCDISQLPDSRQIKGFQQLPVMGEVGSRLAAREDNAWVPSQASIFPWPATLHIDGTNIPIPISGFQTNLAQAALLQYLQQCSAVANNFPSSTAATSAGLQ